MEIEKEIERIILDEFLDVDGFGYSVREKAEERDC